MGTFYRSKGIKATALNYSIFKIATVGEVNVIAVLGTHLQLNVFTFNNHVYLSIKIHSSIHLVIFVAPIFKTLKNYFLWFFMITLQFTGPNNGNRTLAPNTSRIVNKTLFWIFIPFFIT